jgi:cytochrome b involved in lipid metabolism
LWVSLDGLVYNLTDYLKYHPGGKVLSRAAGKESIDMFSNFLLILDQYHSWVNYKHVLKKYQVGYLEV